MLSEFLSEAVDIVWGLPLVIILLGTGIYLSVLSRLKPLTASVHALRLLFGFANEKTSERAPGQLTHFKALSNALAATIGMGNIAGVAVAINQGGPGAIFWMWVAALIGMNTKFFECSLAVMYRGKDYKGEVQGGPMYVIEKALPKALFPLAIGFAAFGLFGTMPLFNVNQMAKHLEYYYQINPAYVGILFAAMVFYSLRGGLKRLANITSTLVPVMCVFYVIICMAILIMNAHEIPGIFSMIFSHAFTGNALYGGSMGAGVVAIMRIGIKRASFSNEAGMGTAPMAHSNVKTTEPISEGLVAMLGPFIDTIIVCTMTALVVLTIADTHNLEADGVLLTGQAFEASLPFWGKHFLTVALLLFSFTTALGLSNYNLKCWNFLFKGRKFFGDVTFQIWFCSALILGSISALKDVINLMDISFAFMAICNLIATVWLAPKVCQAFKSYSQRKLEFSK